MKSHRKQLLAIVLGCFSLVCAGARAQTPTALNVSRPLTGVPAKLMSYMNVLGARMEAGGKEQTVYTGEVVDATGAKLQVRVTYQLPGLVRLEGFKPSVMSFDGQATKGVVSLDDELLLETFIMDTQEGLLTWALSGAAVRVLGIGFGPDPRVVRNYTGPRYDIVEVGGILPYRTETIRSKQYYFDSVTGLLQSTRYSDYSRTPAISLETRFSQWQTLDSSRYPGRIDRYEGGRLVSSFTAQNITSATAADPASF